MLRIPGMPLLPGTLFRDISKTNYLKPQTLQNYRGIGMLSDRQHSAAADITGKIPPECPAVESSSVYPPRVGPKMPPWVVYDKKVLCFNAYFKQTLQEVFHAPYLVRKVKIYFFLEDGTIQIIEPKVENSGLVQGCLLHRQRVPRAPPCENNFITILDLNVDRTVKIFDRSYHITNCDPFTRHFLNKRGITVPDPVAEPEDPSGNVRKQPTIHQFYPPAKKNPFAKFLKYDRQVLKFQAYWDDRSEFGDVRKLEICYYLADDTVEIKEILPRNSGRQGPSIFLKRSRLPREYDGLPLPGKETNITVLNVLGNSARNIRYCVDPLNTGAREVLYYNERDFQIGAVINVYGRAIVITDCDPYTRDYYCKKFGIDNCTPLPTPTRSDECSVYNVKDRVLPPYNGWGSYEDSIGNCISVEPKSPMADFKKFIKYDRYVLRFGAKLLSTIRENCERIFVISYFLSDDTIQIFEIAVRNSGFLGGEFIKRSRIELPGQEKFSSKTPLFYRSHHFFVGATMSFRDFFFHIVSADEYTLLFMEHHPNDFPYSNVKLIMEKLRKSLTGHMREFIEKCVPNCDDVMSQSNVFISFDSLNSTLISLMGNEISDHEIITLCRFYSADQPLPEFCNRDIFQAAAHLEMKRAMWNGREEVIEHFHHINPTNHPFLSESKIRSAIRGCRIPISAELLNNVLQVLNRNECGEIEVCDFLNFIDLTCDKACSVPPMHIAFELCPKVPFLTKGRMVNFSCFLKDLDLKLEEDSPKKVASNF